jgi:hypothetical protein
VVYTKESGGNGDREIHYAVSEPLRNKGKIQEFNVSRLVRLGMTEQEAKQALKR